MKNLKQVLALGMAFSLSLSTLASAAFTDQESISEKNTEAVELLTALDVIQGYEDGSFKPENTVTRAQMAKMIYTIRNGGNDNADAYKSVSTSFDDIQGHWAEGYIKYLQNTNIVAGKSATKFKPDDIVTTAEAMKMALVLGGYTPDKAGLEGAEWLNNTVSWATTNKLDKNVVSPMAGACTRQDAAQILSNALNMNAVQWSEWTHSFVNDGSQGLATGEPITVGEKWMDLSMETGRILDVPSGKKNAKGLKFEYETGKLDSNNSPEKKTVNFKNVTGDYSHLLGCEVTVVWNNDNVDSADAIYGIYASSDNVTYETTWKDVSADGNKVKFGGTSYKIEGNTFETYVDGAKLNTGYNASKFDEKKYSDKVVFIDNDDDGDLDAVQVNTRGVVEVTYVGSKSITTKAPVGGLRTKNDNDSVIGGSAYETTPKLDDINVYDGIAKGDFAVVSYDKYTDKVTYEKAEVKTATIEGTRTQNGTKEIKVDGNWLKDAEGYNGVAKLSASAGDTVEYVEMNGLVYNVKKTDGKWGANSIAMIYNVETAGGEFETGVKAQVILRDGTKKTVKVSEVDGVSVDSLNTVIDSTNNKKIADYIGIPMAYNGGSEMKFKTIDVGADNIVGFDNVGIYNGAVYDGGKNYAGVEIADDAVVFVYDQNTPENNKDNDVKVVTGAELKKAKADVAYSLVNSADGDLYATQEVNGFNYVYMMSVAIDLDKFHTRGSSYGYLLSDSYEATEEGKDYRVYKLWTESGEITAYEETSDFYKYETGDVITYEVASTKDDKTYIKSVGEPNKDDYKLGKVEAVDGNFVGIEGIKGELVNDSVVLNVNTDTNEGISYGEEARSQIAPADISLKGKANARYIIGKDNEILFLLIDTANNKIMSGDKENMSESALKGELENAKAGDTVKVEGNVPAGTFKVKAGVDVDLTDATIKDDVTFEFAGNGGASKRDAVQVDDVAEDECELFISGGMTVEEQATLTVEGDVYFRKDATVSVGNNATVTVNGVGNVHKGAITISETGATFKIGNRSYSSTDDIYSVDGSAKVRKVTK